MALVDPFAAYNARDSVEANFVGNLIQSAGINAFVIEDVSNIGLSAWTGPMPELHKPQVWIERADAERVRQILDDYEQREAARREQSVGGEDADPPDVIRVICEECEQTLEFPSAQRGTVEICPHCGRYVDVDDREDEEEWWRTDEDNDDPHPPA